jgi:FkbM family methyltransferase
LSRYLGPIFSNFIYFLGRALRQKSLIRWAFQLDPKNFRVAEHLLHSGTSRKEFETLFFEMLLLIDRSSGTKSSSAAFLNSIVQNFSKSKAQMFQDIFALSQSGWKKQGFFVEVGVADGVFLSNSFLLEKDYDWKGLLVEPDTNSHASIRKNRTAPLDISAAFSKSGLTLEFLSDSNSSELSTLAEFSNSDSHSRKGNKISVKTKTLTELFEEYKVPQNLDYLSVDTEGSEVEVLTSLDFSKYKPQVITVEHNFNMPKLSQIQALLVKNGYTQVFPEFSRWDAWFVRK